MQEVACLPVVTSSFAAILTPLALNGDGHDAMAVDDLWIATIRACGLQPVQFLAIGPIRLGYYFDAGSTAAAPCCNACDH